MEISVVLNVQICGLLETLLLGTDRLPRLVISKFKMRNPTGSGDEINQNLPKSVVVVVNLMEYRSTEAY